MLGWRVAAGFIEGALLLRPLLDTHRRANRKADPVPDQTALSSEQSSELYPLVLYWYLCTLTVRSLIVFEDIHNMT